MFSMKDDLVEIFNALAGSLAVREKVSITHEMTTDIECEVAEELSESESRYRVLSIGEINQSEIVRRYMPLHVMVSYAGRLKDVEFIQAGPGFSTFHNPDGTYVCITENKTQLSFTLFRNTNRILIGTDIASRTPDIREMIAAKIDDFIDGFADVYIAGDGYWPDKGNDPEGLVWSPTDPAYHNSPGIKSHECPCIGNASKTQKANVLMRIAYQGAVAPAFEYGWVMAPEDSLHARLDLIWDNEKRALEKGKPFSVFIYSDSPSIGGTMSRVWSGRTGEADTFMCSTLPRPTRMMLSDRMLCSDLQRRIEEAQGRYQYHDEK